MERFGEEFELFIPCLSASVTTDHWVSFSEPPQHTHNEIGSLTTIYSTTKAVNPK